MKKLKQKIKLETDAENFEIIRKKYGHFYAWMEDSIDDNVSFYLSRINRQILQIIKSTLNNSEESI